jgi:hypothetical protein
MSLTLPLALEAGSLIVLAVLVVFFGAVVFGFYTRTGSAIEQRPSDGRGQSPGAEGPSSISTTEDEGEDSTLDTHGTE